jgi:hypothetical protein
MHLDGNTVYIVFVEFPPPLERLVEVGIYLVSDLAGEVEEVKTHGAVHLCVSGR